MSATTCETCGTELVDGQCPKHTLTGYMTGSVIRYNRAPVIATAAPAPAKTTYTCPYCGSTSSHVTGHHKGSAAEVGVQCLWSQWEKATGLTQPFDLAQLDAMIAWAKMTGASTHTSKPRGKAAKAATSTAAPAPTAAPVSAPAPILPIKPPAAPISSAPAQEETEAPAETGKVELTDDQRKAAAKQLQEMLKAARAS